MWIKCSLCKSFQWISPFKLHLNLYYTRHRNKGERKMKTNWTLISFLLLLKSNGQSLQIQEKYKLSPNSNWVFNSTQRSNSLMHCICSKSQVGEEREKVAHRKREDWKNIHSSSSDFDLMRDLRAVLESCTCKSFMRQSLESELWMVLSLSLSLSLTFSSLLLSALWEKIMTHVLLCLSLIAQCGHGMD